MNAILAIALPLLILGLFGLSIWYVAARIRTLFNGRRRWPLRNR